MQSASLESSIKILTLVGAMIAFLWGAYQFLLTQRGQADTRRIEATRPFLDRQLKLYTEATQAVATLATSSSKTDVAAATARFWSLYWGELALVEDKRVEAAMVQLGSAIKAGQTGSQIQGLSLELAHACRDSLAESWGVQQWRNPHSVEAH
ncbi:MAG: hypothetical protein JWL63_1563 [Rhodocyclales bacterium]|nr:hypothetical protein [Rhodocyclales bacterium]